MTNYVNTKNFKKVSKKVMQITSLFAFAYYGYPIQ